MSAAFKINQAGATVPPSPGAGGAAQWLIQAAQLLWKRAGASRLRSAGRQMELVETLALGGRKQLLLVRCSGENFLVGTGADSVQSIVCLANQAADVEAVSTWR